MSAAREAGAAAKRQLQSEFGDNYDSTIADINGFWRTNVAPHFADAGEARDFLSLRLEDGTAVGEHTGLVKALAALAKGAPAPVAHHDGTHAALTPSAPQSLDAVEQEIEGIMRMYGTDEKAYASPRTQNRLKALIATCLQLGGR